MTTWTLRSPLRDLMREAEALRTDDRLWVRTTDPLAGEIQDTFRGFLMHVEDKCGDVLRAFED